MILGEPHLALGVSPGSSAMIRSSSSGIAWFWPSTRSYGCEAPAVPSSMGATSTRTIWPGSGLRRPRPGSRRPSAPGTGPAARSTALSGPLRPAALHPEAARPLELELGPDLDQQVELDRAAVLELEIADRGVGDRLERLGGLGGLPALADAPPPAPSGGWRRRTACGRRPRAPCPGGTRAAGRAWRSTSTRLGLGLPHPVHRTVTRSDLEAESSAVFSTVIWLICAGI